MHARSLTRPEKKRAKKQGAKRGEIVADATASHDAQHVDDGKRNHQENQARGQWVGDEDERQNEDCRKAEPKPLVQLLVDDLERFPIQIPVVVANGTNERRLCGAIFKSSMCPSRFLQLLVDWNVRFRVTWSRRLHTCPNNANGDPFRRIHPPRQRR